MSIKSVSQQEKVKCNYWEQKRFRQENAVSCGTQILDFGGKGVQEVEHKLKEDIF